jgi:hypothetical protein
VTGASVRVIDSFLSNADKVREHALSAQFSDWPGHDGEVYRRVCLTEIPGLRARIEAEMGSVDMLGMGYRLNFAGEPPNAAVHSDLGWGTHALVLYLCDGLGGTAFWRHKASGARRIDEGGQALFEQVRGDWNAPDAWEQTGIVPLRFNRAVIYESALFHSRWPFEAFGDCPRNGRLIAVAFFTPKGTHEHSTGR